MAEVKKIKSDITVLTETKKNGQGNEDIGGFIHIYSGVDKDKRAQAGVSILIKKDLKGNLKSWEQINERIIRVSITWKGHDLEIIGIYAPSENASKTAKQIFYETLSELIENINSRKEIVLLGDFNAWTGKKINDKVVGKYGDAKTNENGEHLIEFCEQHSLKILNGFYQHKNIHKYTWVQPTRNTKSIIDYVITKQETHIQVEDVRVLRGPECGTDHYMVRSKCFLQYRPRLLHQNDNQPAQSKSLETDLRKHNIDALQNDSTSFLYKLRLSQKLSNLTYSSAQNTYNEILNKINEAAYEALGTVERNKKNTPLWWTDDIANAVHNKKQAYQKWLQTNDPDDRRTYARSNREVKNLVTKAKNNSWESKCEELNKYIGSTRSREAWKTIKNLRTNRKETSRIDLIEERSWIEHYSQLLTETRPQFTNISTTTYEVEYDEDDEITVQEVENAIRTLKNRKSCGPQGIPNELLKHSPQVLRELLAYVFTLFYKGHDLPHEWTKAHINNIYKKGDRKNCSNYRGLSVINSLSRLYGKIIKNKIEKEMTDVEEQNGFRAGRSCMDSIFSLKQVIEKRLAHNLSTHIVFIDLTKAYDSVPLSMLWIAMEKQGISKKNIQAVQQLYKNMTVNIKTGNKLTREIPISKGLKQGCCIAPTLFKIYLNEALSLWRRKCCNMGIPIDDDRLYTIHFADDQAILAEDESDIDYMLRKLEEEYTKWGLTINIQKTEYLVVGETPERLQIEMGTINPTEVFKYLGVQISSKAGSNDEIHSRIGQARSATRQLHGLLWSNKITKENKRRMYKTIIESIGLYGAELWEINQRNKSKIKAMEMNYWRRCCRLTRLDRVRNEDIRRQMEIDLDIIDTIEAKRLNWYGHLQRMPENRWPKKIEKWTPPTRRKRGRPRRSWREDVEDAMTARDLKTEDCFDRNRWKLGCEKRRQL